MLIDHPSMVLQEFMTQMLAKGRVPIRLQQGVYQIFHFGGSHYPNPDLFEHYPELGDKEAYGVCDDVDQILKAYPTLNDPKREFSISIKEVHKKDQSKDGGWRWHKWGEYIGTHEITCEYLYDEPIVEVVLCYHIFERKQ